MRVQFIDGPWGGRIQDLERDTRFLKVPVFDQPHQIPYTNWEVPMPDIKVFVYRKEKLRIQGSEIVFFVPEDWKEDACVRTINWLCIKASEAYESAKN